MKDRPTNKIGSHKTGFSHLLAAWRYSLSGARALAKEPAVKHEVLALLVLLVLFYLCDARFSDYLVASILFFILMSIEALNTSLDGVDEFRIF